MQKHLQLISDATPKGRYSIVIMDRASWHSNKIVSEFDNLSIMHLPPYSPELNPIEQVWSWLRQNDRANFAFKDYEDIVEQVISKELKRWSVLLVKINPNCVMSFEVKTTISCNSCLVSTNFSCAKLDHFINSFGITHE